MISSIEEGWAQYGKIFWEKEHIRIIHIIVYYYNCSDFIIIVDLLLCLI